MRYKVNIGHYLVRFESPFETIFDSKTQEAEKLSLSLGGFEPSTLGVGNLRSYPLSYKLNFFRDNKGGAYCSRTWSDLRVSPLDSRPL